MEYLFGLLWHGREVDNCCLTAKIQRTIKALEEQIHYIGPPPFHSSLASALADVRLGSKLSNLSREHLVYPTAAQKADVDP